MSLFGSLTCALGGLGGPLQWLCALAALAAWVYHSYTREYGKWEKRGLFSVRPSFLVGNNGPLISQKSNLLQLHLDLYKKHKEHGYVGVTAGNRVSRTGAQNTAQVLGWKSLNPTFVSRFYSADNASRNIVIIISKSLPPYPSFPASPCTTTAPSPSSTSRTRS